MRVGLQQATYTWAGGPATLGDDLARVAIGAENAGLASFWLMDHFFQIPGWGKPEDHPMLEAYTALGYVAARTSRIKLGTLVSGAIYRHPSVLIKAATTLDVLSGGRAYFGVGAAWFEAEAKGLGIPFPPKSDRFAALEDVVRLARSSWADGNCSVRGQDAARGTTNPESSAAHASAPVDPHRGPRTKADARPGRAVRRRVEHHGRA